MLSKISKTVFPSEVRYDSSIGYYYDFAHNADSDEILVGVFDNRGTLMNANGVFTRLDSNTLRVFFPDNQNYTWTIYVFFEDGDDVLVAPKKRLFEQQTVDAANLGDFLQYRLAFGGPSLQTMNVTLENFKSFCQATLDSSLYLLKGNNLSDILDKAAARNNLNVYSKTEIDTFSGALMPINGFVDTVSSWIAGTTPLTVSCTSAKDILGVSVLLNFSVTSTYNNAYIGYIDVTAQSGFNLSALDQVFQVLAGKDDPRNIYCMGQISVTSTNITGGKRLQFYLSLDPVSSGTWICSSSMHINITKA